ncbi:amino acid ABC transporter permease [Limoniibacter endophyticus]|uniref:Amino acid ABC transporter permease n=1 Tax=Limoniibacter endophyticus TaxID=1565040 RepID=A0A8J3DMS2_9HYPH|nr:amino acid ABC transporter permease [Limoniibacter endophyticus]GHC68515.1 amino acid ABC transporter permease [Limoniibacter endophyticus]
MSATSVALGASPQRSFSFYDPRVRSVIVQAVVLIALILFIYWVVGNTMDNLRRANIASGFAFLNGRAGFDVSQSFVPYSSNSTYWDALKVGFLNTLLVAIMGIVTATILGFIVGIARLSKNWLIRKIAMVYVEVFRNIPPLLVIFFWYFGVLAVLPSARESLELPFSSYINSRGMFMPKPIFAEGAWLIGAAFIAALIAAFLLSRWSRARQARTGQTFPLIRFNLALIFGLPILAYFLSGQPISFNYPEQGRFNLTGGMQLLPEFLALYLALSFYTASFIAEIVRGGILGVPKGQSEASYALGLRPRQALRLVVVPQAMRIVIPPLSSQFLNLTKNSSLAIAIGYPDIVSVGGTILNQSGQAIEVVAIWMLIFVGLSFLTSMLMNWFNAKMALVER